MPPNDRVNNRGENILEKRLRQAYGDLLLYRYSKAREVANNSNIIIAARNHLKEELLKNTAVEPFKDTALRIDFNRAKKITIELSKFVRLDFKAEYKFDKTALDVKFKVLNIIYYGNAMQELPPINDGIDEEIVERAEETVKIYEEIISLLKKNA